MSGVSLLQPKKYFACSALEGVKNNLVTVLEHGTGTPTETDRVCQPDRFSSAKRNAFVMQLQSLNTVVFSVGAGLTVGT